MSAKSIELVPHRPQELLALIESEDRYRLVSGRQAASGLRELFVSGEVSPAWVAALRAATAPDPWSLGFAVVRLNDSLVVGSAGFKGPPDGTGVVEIAYGIASSCRRKGFATEAAQALLSFALREPQARLVRAHTLPESNASTRVLARCGFTRAGEIHDPEDGLVWRWEWARGAA